MRVGPFAGLKLVRLGLVGAALSAGCRNPCQEVCVNMADYAEECNLPISDAEIDACIERQSEPVDEDRAACRDFGDPEVLRAQWTCEDLGRYWGGEG